MRPLLPSESPCCHFARQHVGDGFDAAMRVPWKAGEVVGRVLVAEIVEQEKRVELVRLSKPEGALQFNAGAFNRGLGLVDLFHSSERHGEPPGNGLKASLTPTHPPRQHMPSGKAPSRRRSARKRCFKPASPTEHLMRGGDIRCNR